MQHLITGRARSFEMLRVLPQWPDRLIEPGLYLHVPFCKTLCPYCPYNRVPYAEDLFAAYERAVKQEIDLYAPYLKGRSFNCLYIGGGTPTVNWPGLIAILRHLRKAIGDIGDMCVELHPGAMGGDCLAALKDIGVTRVSIGVESTSDVWLHRIGRSHDGPAGLDAVARALSMGFASVNVDLLFALPGQHLEDWTRDVRRVIALGVDQLSTYPLFTFAYSQVGQKRKIHKVKRPPHRVVKAMLDFTDQYCQAKGFRRCAVWSWLKPGKAKFSSVTRHHYVGFGPSAASMTGTHFYVNTFDVRAYAGALPAGRPVALSMPINRRLERAFWLYWRMYELTVKHQDFLAVFGAGETLDALFGWMLKPLVAVGMMVHTQEGYQVTGRGAYWIHRLQNAYSLAYIDHLWGACRRHPWPQAVTL